MTTNNTNPTKAPDAVDELDKVIRFIRNASLYNYVPDEWKAQSVIPSDVHDKATQQLKRECRDAIKALYADKTQGGVQIVPTLSSQQALPDEFLKELANTVFNKPAGPKAFYLRSEVEIPIIRAVQRYALEQRLEELLLMGKGTGYTVIGYRLWQNRITELKQQLAELEEEK